MEVYHREFTVGARIMVGVHMYDTNLNNADSPMVKNEKQRISIMSDLQLETQVYVI